MKKPLDVFFFPAVLFAARAAGVSAKSKEVHDTQLEGAKAIFDWVAASAGGIVTPKQAVRRAVPGDLNSPLIVSATERIEPGEVIVRVPWDNIIKSDNPDDDGQMPCGTVQSLAREMRLGKDSKYAPYVMYLNEQSDSQIPSVWSKAAQDLFLDVLGDGDIPPFRATTWISRDLFGRCKGDPDDKILTKAALMVIQRSDDAIMIPGYDAYNHRNGNWTSTETIIKEGVYHQTVAVRAIEKGEEIYLSYNLCKFCGGRKRKYGTAEILRDYGFVEQMPQRWHFTTKNYHFDVDEPLSGEISVKWHKELRPKSYANKEKAAIFFRSQIRRLLRIKNVDWGFDYYDKKDIGMTKDEWDTIWKFVDANIVAMDAALASLGPSFSSIDTDGTTLSTSSGADAEDNVPVSLAVGGHYDSLEPEIDNLPYAQDTCNFKKWMKQYKKTFDNVETTQTSYQKLVFKKRPMTDDICMELDKIVQICSNYRPHYHEYMTHAAARFVKDVRRIIFIGGGDSMLLHEALKYPNLELVVGLELDQTVTRKAFKYFNTRPHFEDERVEWWFGDATKSLLLLPEDYFGSFDLVLVDLSETVMSMSVTDELDVFDALSLLLSPSGVMVKNEMYKDKFNEVFDYTMELYYICPVICDQVLVFGSNNVDFYHAPTYDHGVETFLYSNMHTPETRFDLMHHFKKNVAPADICMARKQAKGAGVGQKTAAGIVEIVNAENTSILLDRNIVNIIKDVAQQSGFTVTIEPIFDGNFGVVVMEEGYIAARMWPNENYVGFDINLWGKTYTIKSLKSELVKAVGSTNVSSYKIVVGGIYDSNTWKEDQQVIGPKLRQLRNCDEDAVTEGSLTDKFANSVAVEEVVPLTLAHDITAAVVCGKQGDDCVSMKALMEHSNVKNVIHIYECPDIQGMEVEKMIECERMAMDTLKEALDKSGTKLNLLVLDGGASFRMHQIFNSIMVADKNRERFLEPHSITVTWSSSLTEESWRREFLDRLRKRVEYDPAVRAEVVFQAGGKSYELGIFSTANENSSYHLASMESRLRERLAESSGAHIELRNVHGALYKFIEDYNPTVFRQEDYDSKPGRDQFAQQVPLGRQTILQFVRKEKSGLQLFLNKISKFLTQSLKAVDVTPLISRKYAIGDGGVLIALHPEVNVIVVWDGQNHIDVNFFSFKQSPKQTDVFRDAFLKSSDDKLIVGLRDDQPRGVGGVVNFLHDML